MELWYHPAMKKEELKEWTDSTRKTLKACRKFSKLCGKPFDRGFIGELLVLERMLKTYGSRICASAENGFKYVGSASKGWDVSLTLDNQTVFVNAKATTMKDRSGPKWVRQHASNFCHIKFGPLNRQKLGKVKKGDPDLFYVFVDVGTWIDSGTSNFFTLSYREAASICKEEYKPHDGEIRKNKTTDFHFVYADIKRFNDPNLRRLFRK